MSRVFKSRGIDKFDGCLGKERRFVHDNWGVGNESEYFNNPSGFLHRPNERGTFFGIEKRIWRVSGRYIGVDGSDIGKSDQ